MSNSFRERFLDVVCAWRVGFVALLGFDLMLLLLSIFAFGYIEPGTPTYWMLQIDLFILTIIFLGVGTLLLLCRRRITV